MTLLPLRTDQTLDAADAELEAKEANAARFPRPYLGASAIGKECDRELWLSFRWARERAMSAKGIKAVADGHHCEALQAERLRLVKGVELYTADPESPDNQIGFSRLNGHFKGNLDGVIVGLIQAPKPHVWEHKAVNEKKWRNLFQLVATDESSALEHWDMVYFVQAQVYMGAMEIDRHYLTCTTPGGRDVVSVRTRFNKEVYDWALERAERIIEMADPPLKLSDDPEHFACRWCDFKALCHGTREAPKVSCRTCGHSTPSTKEGDAPWRCDLLEKPIETYADQMAGCRAHMYHPHLIAHFAEMIGFDPDSGSIIYRMRSNGREFRNGYRGDSAPPGVHLSHEIRVASLSNLDLSVAGSAAEDFLVYLEEPDIEALKSRFGATVEAVHATP